MSGMSNRIAKSFHSQLSLPHLDSKFLQSSHFITLYIRSSHSSFLHPVDDDACLQMNKSVPGFASQVAYFLFSSGRYVTPAALSSWFSRSRSSLSLHPCSLHASDWNFEPLPSAKSSSLTHIPTPRIFKFCRTPSYMLRTKRSSHSSSEQAENKIHCWSCGERKSDKRYLVCPSCKAIQFPDSSIDYFQMFDQDRKYDLDVKDLEGKYKNLMKKLHPDVSHGKSQEEQGNSATLSAIVTRSYQELLKPVSRATYLLKLQGIHVEEEGTVSDPELLMEVMEIRETFEHTSDKKTLQQLLSKAKTRMDDWESSFAASLKEGNSTAAVAALQRMSYFSRLFEDIKRKLL